MEKKGHLIVVCGPTGIGKTSLSIQLARELGSEIISSDSRQFYREMRIGTAVPTLHELDQVPHHFIHSHAVTDNFNASHFEQDVLAFLAGYFQRKAIAMLVGGSGMYIDAVCNGIDDLPTITAEVRQQCLAFFEKEGLEALQQKIAAIDPDYYGKVDQMNHKRMLKAFEVFVQTGKRYSSFLTHCVKERPFYIHKIALNTDREYLYTRINQRVDQMVEEGLVDEARSVYIHRNLTPLKTVGYKELFQYFDGELSLEEAIQQIKNHSRAYARRQLTWFRRDKQMNWFEYDDAEGILKFIHQRIKAPS